MKKLMLICAPVTSRSGYGSHARDLTYSFVDSGEYDVKILDVPWGSCPRNALDKNKSRDKKMLDCILKEPKTDRQPDIYVDIRIPNEFQQWGKFNIGITAGIETHAVSQEWMDGCNKMDLIIVPSEVLVILPEIASTLSTIAFICGIQKCSFIVYPSSALNSSSLLSLKFPKSVIADW